LKGALYEFASADSALAPQWRDELDWTGSGSPTQALDPILRRAGKVDAVGHRIVHGGKDHRASVRITPAVRSAIAAQAELTPAHNRLELAAIDAASQVLGPAIPQVAVFDTGFHATLAPAAYVYAGPHEWLTSSNIRRYGFHGISFQYSSRRAAQLLGGMPPRLLICHLGGGASLCAVRDGKSVDTTMGFTPLEGLMMGTRSGSLDPGILIYLVRHRGYSADDLDRILNRESGLAGVSGFSSDMRDILHQAGLGNERAQLALDVYKHRLVREAGGMLAALGGLDALVFTGGIGENAPLVRDALCRQFAFLNLLLDPAKNADPKPDGSISADGSAIAVLVIHTQEEWEIARECYRVLTH
ncbi:MAG: acetate/propionate family kinase, partial [Bryobacteraceae bacterium]